MLRYCSLNDLEPDPFHLVLDKTLLGPVVELGRPGAFVGSHFLRVIESADIREIGSNSGCAKGVIADRLGNAGRRAAPAIIRQASGWPMGLADNIVLVASRGAKQPALSVLGDAGGVDVGTQRLRERMVAGHRVLLPTLFVESDRPPRTEWPEILDLHHFKAALIRAKL